MKGEDQDPGLACLESQSIGSNVKQAQRTGGVMNQLLLALQASNLSTPAFSLSLHRKGSKTAGQGVLPSSKALPCAAAFLFPRDGGGE